jgi:peptidoglycan-associated lipoprotein
MRRSSYRLDAAAGILLALLISGIGCGKKTPLTTPSTAEKTETSAPDSSATSPAPVITLAASPSAIEKGRSSTLTWNSSNATGVNIDNGIGTVEASGSRTISPATSTTYRARATGPGGNAVSEARVTVTAPSAITDNRPSPVIGDIPWFEANIEDVYFDYDQSGIREDAKATLQKNAKALAERPGIRITVEGHCDERGSEKYNLALGDMRANAVKEYLVSQGVSSNRIDTISFGKERNFCEDHNEECWQLNRRGHFVMR